MRINRLSFWDSISVWISSLSRSRIESRLKFLVSEIGTLLCFPLSYDYWISFSPPLLFFPLLSSFFFLPFFHSARRKCKCIVTELLFQFFWLSSSRKYVDVEIEWNLSSVFFVLFYFLSFHLTRGIRIFFISNDFELECFIRYINV